MNGASSWTLPRPGCVDAADEPLGDDLRVRVHRLALLHAAARHAG